MKGFLYAIICIISFITPLYISYNQTNVFLNNWFVLLFIGCIIVFGVSFSKMMKQIEKNTEV